ncbi:MAG: hypothetical protein EPO68_15670 [Planctomycetota bacterium]|nr:MAG: hypothetical protein EPO68_15670 [Planctomycetota bacterium]
MPDALLLLLLLPLTTDWTVDPAGGGDFTSIGAALAAPAVQSGDRLWIAPGEYGFVVVEKAVDLLALPGLRYTANSVLLRDLGAATGAAGTTTVQGLTTNTLRIDRCAGRIELVDVEVGRDAVLSHDPALPMVAGKCEIFDADDVRIAGSLLRGSRQCYPEASSPKPGLLAARSRIAISNSTLTGGDDLGLEFWWSCSAHYPSPPALSAGACELWLSAVELRGGATNWSGSSNALYLNGGFVDARGTGAELWSSGQAATPAIAGTGKGTLSGIALLPAGLPPWLASPPIARPLLVAPAVADLGGSATVELYAPLGAPALLALSPHPAFAAAVLPRLGPVWFALDQPYVLHAATGLGETVPAARSFALPADPALAGASFTLQALVRMCAPGTCGATPPYDVTPPLTALLH